jgi:hypothetical protein
MGMALIGVGPVQALAVGPLQKLKIRLAGELSR